MPKQTFIEKFIDKFDRIDRNEILAVIVKLSREKGFLENILNSLNDGVIVLNNEKEIQFINDAAGEIMGVKPGSDLTGKPAANFMKDGSLRAFLAGEEPQNGQSVSREIDISYPRRLILSMSVIPLFDENDKMYGIAVIMRDVTEKRRVEGRMAQSEKLGALSVLAAGLAHEIGNPLNSLHIHAQLIEKEFKKLKTGKKKLAELIGVVSEEIKRIDDIARGFLQAIRPLKPKFEEEDINAVIEKTLKFMMPELEKEGIAVRRNYYDSLPMTLIDKSQLKQAFLNIIKNSMQAMPKGGLVSVSTESHGDMIKAIFEDNGVGIAPENISKIFDPYFTTRKDGMGLGLMMTYRIIKEHGGEIEVKSQPGKGTGFTIILPVRTGTPKMLPGQ